MQTKVCLIYLLRKFDMFFASLKTRYDMNSRRASDISRIHIDDFNFIEIIIPHSGIIFKRKRQKSPQMQMNMPYGQP